MSDDLHFWTVIGIDETRIPELKRLENLLNELQNESLNEEKLLNSTDVLIRILENLCKNAYPIFKTIDLQTRGLLFDCVSNKWYPLRKELKRILPRSTTEVLHHHAQAFAKLCTFDFNLHPLMFAKQASTYKDMPVQLESELINLIEKMRKQHRRMLEDILKDQYEQIKKHHREKIVITVLGSTKASKSSLINFLLKDEICPTDNRAATARLTRITYGEHIRLTLSGSQRQSFLFDNTQQLLAKAQEVIILKNADRKSKLCQDEVFIELPIEELKGLELWDIPGFDENHIINNRITEILKDTDLILAVLSQQESLRQTSIDFIKPCLQQQDKNRPQSKICFIISQIDRFKPDDHSKESLELFLQHIYEKICAELPTNFPPINYKDSDQFIPMCSHPRHNIKDYIECREEFIRKSCYWFNNALYRFTYDRTELLLKSIKEFSNYENIFLQQARYQRMRKIFNERFILFGQKLSEKINKKLSEIHLMLKQSITDIVNQSRELFYQSASLEAIEEYIQDELTRKFQEILSLKSPDIIEIISKMTVEFSNTIDLKPPEIQILKDVLNETLTKDHYSNIIGQYQHTSPYHLSAYFNRIFHALSETLKATVKITYGDFEQIRKAYDQFIPREKYVEERTMQSISEAVNEVLDTISDKVQQKTEKTVKKILIDKLKQIENGIEKQIQTYLHSSSKDTKIDHLRQFAKENALNIKQMHLDILDLQFNLDFSSNYQIDRQERLDQHNHFPVFAGILGETKQAIAAKLIPLRDLQLQEVLYIREIKHKNVMKYYGVKKNYGDQYCIIMPRLDCNLTSYLHEEIFDPPAIDDLIVQIITGLDYIHSELEFIHRNIRVDNILVNKEKRRFVIAHLGGIHRQIDAYTAPELTPSNNGSIITEKCDIFSLGIMIKEIIRLTNLEEHADVLVTGWLRLTKKCCSEEPVFRPSCKKLLERRFRHDE